jgi:hypothetical protein
MTLITEQIEKLAELRDKSILTEEEFQQQKTKLLNSNSQKCDTEHISTLEGLADFDNLIYADQDTKKEDLKYVTRLLIFLSIIGFLIGLRMSGFVAVCITVSLWVYFVPTIVAYYRRHHNKLAIHWTNVFLGWTFLGWVITLIWSCTNNIKRQE